MKKLFILLAFGCFSLGFSQDNDSLKNVKYFVGEVPGDLFGFKRIDDKCNPEDLVKLEKDFFRDNLFQIEDYILCSSGNTPKFYYKIFNGNNSYIIPTEKINIISEDVGHSDVQLYFSNLNAVQKWQYKSRMIESVKNIRREKELKEELREAEADHEIITEGLRVLKSPTVILDFAFRGEYSTGFYIEFLNNSSNRVKYVYFTVAGYNDVDDRVLTYGGEAVAKKTGVGPVEPNESVSWSFEDIWPNSQFGYGRILSVTVQYFNGTKKTVTKVGDIVLSEDYLPALDRVKKYMKDNPEVN